jgi:serine/threonine-protein kinase HipA
MATAAGQTVSAHRLLPARTAPGYFATRRFDRPDSGGRLHIVSLAGAIEAPSNLPASYDLFRRATRAIARRADDVDATSRRMVFNVLACNRDDHTRQHAYLMDPAGEWRLSPAFDLTYAPGPGGEHYLDIEGEGRRPTRAHVTSLAKRHGLDARRVAAMVEAV